MPVLLFMNLLCAARAAEVNLARVASASTSFVSGHETINALNDGFDPRNSNDKRHGAYGNWPRTGTQWVQYEWAKPISTAKIDVYWFDDRNGVRLPTACRLKYWDGSAFIDVSGATGLGIKPNEFNTTTFPEITTLRLRLEFDGNDRFSTGILDWRVYDTGKSPNFPPVPTAGVDRVAIKSVQTHLAGSVRDDAKPRLTPDVRWTKESGPGKVTFANTGALTTTAGFSAAGDYVLKMTANDGELTACDTLKVTVEPPPPARQLEALWPAPYQLSSPFWRPRVRAMIVNWIPHCIQKISDPSLPEGGIENFAQAANKLAGKPAKHAGAPFANAWVYNTVESICLALMIEPQGDQDIIASQAAMRKTLEEWIPKILAAQEPDGYLHTIYTINGHRRWSNKYDHEGYNAGYFIEAAIAHSLLTNGQDRRLLDAALRLADCWCQNLGPAPKQSWYEGHEELEQALVRLARFVESKGVPGKGRQYVELAKFLLDCRRNGDSYDQSHLPVTQQYEAVGHAVRAAYCYSGMVDVAMETRDMDYFSAVRSLWGSVVNRKYYVTGGIGSGDTSEGFGKEYSLPNNRAYSESCADCGELFFQHKMQMAYHDSRYADLFEETLYNAVLGSVDLDGQNFTYTNPLDSEARRYKWHACPCCVGNIPRTLLMLPSWMYTKGADSLYVNLYVGSTVKLDNLADTRVELVQTTDYPWRGQVTLKVNPETSKRFSLKLRIPNRNTSTLYPASPACDSLTSLAVNGVAVKPEIEKGYAIVNRKWKAGDTIELALPLPVQRVKADTQIKPNVGRVALRRGPLVYNIESVDQKLDLVLGPASPLTTEWKDDLLGGVMVIKGAFTNSEPLLAIPNYARLNRGGRSIVWLKDK